VTVNYADGADHNHEDNGQGHGVFGNVLSLVIGPKFGEEEGHLCTSLSEMGPIVMQIRGLLIDD